MDFGPKSNIIKTSLGFQFPTKLISESRHGFIRWFLSKNIDFIHGYPWKSHASVETKKHETSTWTGLWDERTPFGGIISFHVEIPREETYAYTM